MHVRAKALRGLSACSAGNKKDRRLITAWQLELPGKELPGKEESVKILNAVRRIFVQRSIIL